MMNPHTQNLNRLEFVITYACTGRCKHCSEGDHLGCSEYLDRDAAVQVVYKVAEAYHITSLMTFGGEPLLRPETVCRIHRAAREMHIPKRQLITNGFFSKDVVKIRDVAMCLANSGVNDILLSVDAFHQETIPLEPVKMFAAAVKAEGIPLRTQPAWLVSTDAENPYNRKTREILKEFEQMGITTNDGNVIFPSGNARIYLKEYFDLSQEAVSPYAEDPRDIRGICIDPNGAVLGENIHETDILDILERYAPKR